MALLHRASRDGHVLAGTLTVHHEAEVRSRLARQAMEQAADEAMGTAAARLSRFLDRDDDGLDAVDWSDDRDTFRTGPGSGGTTPEDEDEDPLGLDELLRPAGC